MRPVMYAFIFAIVFLIFKAFFLDDYIARHYGDDANATAENNISSESNLPATPPVQPEPEVKPIPQEKNISTAAPEKQEKKADSEDKKMPLDKLGDSLSKHIKL